MSNAETAIHPSKEEIALLPPYARLPSQQIHVVRSRSHEQLVIEQLSRIGIAGFDTETKPVFTPQTRPDGPHVVQLATLNHAFIFQVHLHSTLPFLKELLESQHLVKVGFGLSSDRRQLEHKLGISLRTFVDVASDFRPLGYRQRVGAKAAVAIVLGQRLLKSKSITTSNWALTNLSASQMQYAADDAHAALAVYLALGCPAPIVGSYKVTHSVEARPSDGADAPQLECLTDVAVTQFSGSC